MCPKPCLSILAAIAAVPSIAWCGVLQIGAPDVDDARVTVPIVLEGAIDNGVAALDFRLAYDPAAFKPVSVEAGTAALDADKRVEWNVRNPGECIVVMMGMNQVPCHTGEVARVAFQRIGGAGGAQHQEVAVTRPTFSSFDGKLIPAEGSRKSLFLGGDPQNTPDQTEPDAPADDDSPGAPGRDSAIAEDEQAQDREILAPAEAGGVSAEPVRHPGAAEGDERDGTFAARDDASSRPGARTSALRRGIDRSALAAGDLIRQGIASPLVEADSDAEAEDKTHRDLTGDAAEGDAAAVPATGDATLTAQAAPSRASSPERHRGAAASPSSSISGRTSTDVGEPAQSAARWLYALGVALVGGALIVVHRKLSAR
ncbi:MAG TPA: hypothetical protein ENN80_10105 [Candidatus Hydrogenedentes bacterium]|nr:hypothetical protein [Candidatus Hydrogenedentota bacterium]